eukprot:328438_1
MFGRFNENKGNTIGQDECYYYSHGYCHYGDSCWFVHTPSNDRRNTITPRSVISPQQREEQQKRLKQNKYERNINQRERLNNLDFSGKSKLLTQIAYSRVKSIGSNIVSHLSALNLCQMSIWLDTSNIKPYAFKLYILYQLGLQNLAHKCLQEMQHKFDENDVKLSIANIDSNDTANTNNIQDNPSKSSIYTSHYQTQNNVMNIDESDYVSCHKANNKNNKRKFAEIGDEIKSDSDNARKKQRLNNQNVNIPHSLINNIWMLNTKNKNKIQFYENLFSNLQCKYFEFNFHFCNETDESFYAIFALFNMYDKAIFNLQQTVERMELLFDEYDGDEEEIMKIRDLLLSVFLVLLFVKPNDEKFTQFVFSFVKYCNHYFGDNCKGKQYFDGLLGVKNYSDPDSDYGFYGYEPPDDYNFFQAIRNNKYFWLFDVGRNYWIEFIRNLKKFNAIESNHFLGFQIVKITSISNNKLHGYDVNDELLYNNEEKDKFAEWSTRVWDMLKYDLCNCRGIYQIVLFYCRRAEANIFYVKVLGVEYCDCRDSLNGKPIPTELQVNNIQFGDVIDIIGPEQPEAPMLYFVDIDIDNITLKLHAMTLTTDHDASIPLAISKKLCDPLQFYQFFSPICGIDYQYDIFVPFKNYFIQQALGIYDAINVDCQNFELYEEWKFNICFPKSHMESGNWKQNVSDFNLISIHFNISIPVLFLSSFRYLKSNKDQLPLIYFVEKYYFKQIECKKLKQKLQHHTGYDMYGFDAYYIDENNYDGHMFNKIRHEKPISWGVGLSFSCFDYVGLDTDIEEMKTFVNENKILLCYRIIIKDVNELKPTKGKNINISYLLGYVFQIICAKNSRQEVRSKGCGYAWEKDYKIYCSVEMSKKDWALAILNGFKLLYVPSLKWRFVKPFVTQQEFNYVENSMFSAEKSKYSNDKCIELVQYLLKREKLRNSNGKYAHIPELVYQLLHR